MRAACAAQVVAYNTVIDLLGKMGRWEEALQMYTRMRREGLTPVTRTYNTLMIAANNCGQWKEALGLFDELLRSRQALNTTSYNALISAYTKAGSLPKVLEAFRRMFDEARPPRPPARAAAPHACMLLPARGRATCLALTLHLYGCWDQCTGYQACGVRPGPAGRLLQAKGPCGPSAGGAPAGATGRRCVAWGAPDGACRAQGCERSVITYSSLITACEKAGEWGLALDFFRDMPRDGCRPNVVTYNSLLSALSNGAPPGRAPCAPYPNAAAACAAPGLLPSAAGVRGRALASRPRPRQPRVVTERPAASRKSRPCRQGPPPRRSWSVQCGHPCSLLPGRAAPSPVCLHPRSRRPTCSAMLRLSCMPPACRRGSRPRRRAVGEGGRDL